MSDRVGYAGWWTNSVLLSVALTAGCSNKSSPSPSAAANTQGTVDAGLADNPSGASSGAVTAANLISGQSWVCLEGAKVSADSLTISPTGRAIIPKGKGKDSVNPPLNLRGP